MNAYDGCFRQVKTSFPDLDLSHVSIDAQAQTPTQPVHSESIDELFADDALVDDPQGDEETAPFKDQAKSADDEAHPLDGDPTIEEFHEETPVTE